ncbi:MAG: rhomboid family intramembrane serine protease [Phycisphaerales bacterium]|nr:rhomboid family intramembrane serine protease [Phycisphaerales bacterium]
MSESSTLSIPWESPNLLPAKPPGADYGFVLDRQAHATTPQQLLERLSKADAPPVSLVWTPDSDRLVPPGDVDFLFPANRIQRRLELIHALKTALYNGLIWIVIAASVYGSAGKSAALMYLLVAIFIGAVPALQGLWSLWRMKNYSPAEARREATQLRYAVWLSHRPMRWTWAIGAVLIAVYIVQMNVGLEPSFLAAGLIKPLVHQGQAWRMLSCALLHGSLLHLAFNFMALISLGKLIEAHADRIYLPILFVVCALTGSALSTVMMPEVPSVGASGALMGMVGFCAVLGYRRRSVMPAHFLRAILLSIGLIALMGIIAYNMIDNAAHLGGLLGGLLLGGIYVRRRITDFKLRPSAVARLTALLCAAILLATTIWTILQMLRWRPG